MDCCSKQILELQNEISRLKKKVETLEAPVISPASAMQRVRNECRRKYFGTLEDARDGKIEYGPGGRQFSDYEVISGIINKTAGLIFKYQLGKTQSTCITKLVQTSEDLERYKDICEMVCADLKEKIMEATHV